jgi:hypothetical protein
MVPFGSISEISDFKSAKHSFSLPLPVSMVPFCDIAPNRSSH